MDNKSKRNRKPKSNKLPLAIAGRDAKLLEQPITDEMKTCYLDYAMSVIVARALPDVRDGLKPVHRRILYAMWSLGLKPSAKFRKSATVVGEVLGKYHPHGDVALYDTLVRMAQDFAMRYPLVWGQGNFGSIDGDSAAAMRYTESKLSHVTEALLTDIEKETVDFTPNYDNTIQEPVVLPSRLPNLLLNGGMGIAVGMATNIPPHNLREVCQAINHMVDHPEAEVADLLQFIKGPDFPTGGLIYDRNEINQAYITGKGKVLMRAKTEIEEEKSGLFRIIISEIPYQVNKSSLLEKIALLVKEKKLEHIRDIRDESDKDGLRIVIELKKEGYPKKILNKLFKTTQLQDTFYVNMLALVDGIQPRVLTLKGILEEFIKHRQIVIRRRTEFDLRKAEARAHILEGLKLALDNINEVITIIKKSKDKVAAKLALMARFKFSEIQTDAILEMRLHQLANLERQRIEDELKEKLRLIKEYKFILAHPEKVLEIVKTETQEMSDKYGDDRRTKVVSNAPEKITQEDLIAKEACVIAITQDGYIKRFSPEIFKTQARGGQGVKGLTTKEEDLIDQLITTDTLTNLLFFTTYGKVFQLKAHEVPFAANRLSKGQALVNFLQIDSQEKVSAVLPLDESAKQKKFLVMATQKGFIKKVPLKDFEIVRRSGLNAIKLEESDRLEWVKASSGEDDVMLITAHGKAIRFKEGLMRSMGRAARGVRSMRLKRDDQIVTMDLISPSSVSSLMIITERGYGKRTKVNQYRPQGRGGSGIGVAKVTAKTGPIVSAMVIDENNLPEGKVGDLLVMSRDGQTIRFSLKAVKNLGRVTQGISLMRFKNKDDRVATITLV